MSRVAVVEAREHISSALERVISLSGGFIIKQGSKVVIKPNICNAKNPNNMVITDFKLIQEAVRLVRKSGGKPLLVESDNIAGNAYNRLKESGLAPKLNEWGVPFMNLSEDECIPHNIADTTIEIPKTVLDAEYFINLAKMKTCAHTLVTLGIKNLFGCLKEAKKSRLHKRLDEILPFLAKTIRCDMTIVDGITCMEGNGPTVGNPIEVGILVAGRDIVSIDSMSSRIMGFEPSSIPHIAKTAELGVGQLEDYDIIGDNWKNYACRFERPYSIKATFKTLKTLSNVYLKH